MTSDEVKKLAKALAAEMRRSTSLLVSSSGVAEMLDYATGSASVREILADKTFPAPATLTERGEKKWRRADVAAWIDRKFGGPANG